jgi:ParB family chromosome partitioning protein
MRNDDSITAVPLTKLYSPEFHPFQVREDQTMDSLVKSIKAHGILVPGIVRPHPDDGYELVSGNRRKRACEIAGLEAMPVIIRDMDDDEAAIVMVDSNLEHRESLLPSEKAWAYRLKLEALNHRGSKSDTPCQLSVEVLCEQTGDSKNQIYRFVRLTELIPDLIDKVDVKLLAMNPAVELSYLSRMEQLAVANAMVKYEVKPSLSQAIRLKKMKQEKTLTPNSIDGVLSETKESSVAESTTQLRYRKFFPPEYSSKQIETVIICLLRDWQAAQRGEDASA